MEEGSSCLHRKHLGGFLPLSHKAILLTPAWLLQTYPLLKFTAFPKAARQPLTYLSEAQGAKKPLLPPARLHPTVEQSILQQKMISQVILAMVTDTELPAPHGQLGLSISGLWGTTTGAGRQKTPVSPEDLMSLCSPRWCLYHPCLATSNTYGEKKPKISQINLCATERAKSPQLLACC